MKIVVFYGDSPLASWSLSRGLPAVFRRMGHEVVEICPLPHAVVKRSDAERINKPITSDVDLVLVSGPEYLATWIETFYPKWKEIEAVKVGWYHESEVRDDRVADFADLGTLFDLNFMPNAEDAAKHKAIHLRVGVDTELFWSGCSCAAEPGRACSRCGTNDWNARAIDCAFLGTLYEKRHAFLNATAPLIGKRKIRVGQALVHDLDGINPGKSIEILAGEYRRVKVLLNLPTLSRVLVSKILEASASGCLVLTPEPLYADVGVAYDPKPETLAAAIKYWLDNPRKAAKRAEQERQKVLAEHRMEQRLETLLALSGFPATVNHNPTEADLAPVG